MNTKRWLDETSEASERERAVLSSGLEADPPAGAEAAVWAGLAAALAAAPAASVVASASASSAAGATGVAKLTSASTFVTLGKGFALGVGVSLAAAGIGRLEQAPAAHPTPSHAAQPAFHPEPARSSAASPLEPPVPDQAPATPSAAPHSHHPPSSLAPSPVRAPAPGRGTVAGTGAAGTPAIAAFSPANERPPAPASKLEEEAAMLRDARAELRAGRLAEAFAKLEAARERFSLPELAQEREALLIELLHRSGQRASAVEKARRFLGRYPESPHAARVRSIVDAGP